MKWLITLFILLFIAGCKETGNKYFTGTIEYAYSYTSDSLNADSLAKTRPGKSIFRYDTVNYQSNFITAGADTGKYYYSGRFNKSLYETNSANSYQCQDYSAFTDSVISFRIVNTDEKILGYSCKILEIQKKNSWLQYYVSNELRIAPPTYNKHVSYNWDFYGEKANGGLILKSEHRFSYFTMKGIATSLSRRDDNFKALEIGDDLFTSYCK